MNAMTPPDFDALLADTSFVRRLAGALVRDRARGIRDGGRMVRRTPRQRSRP